MEWEYTHWAVETETRASKKRDWKRENMVATWNQKRLGQVVYKALRPTQQATAKRESTPQSTKTSLRLHTAPRSEIPGSLPTLFMQPFEHAGSAWQMQD